MRETIFEAIGRQLRAARATRGLSQSDLSERLGRARSRVSELERDLAGNRWGRDRLTLFAEICDTLDLVPVLVPRATAASLASELDQPLAELRRRGLIRPTFDEVFIDLGSDEEDQG